MIITLDLDHLPSLPALALTIGNFDGVHLGHQAMLNALCDDANARQLKTAVMIFEPQPREFFCLDNPPARLTNLDEKCAILSSLGVDYVLVATFNERFRSLSAQAFCQLLTTLNVKHLVLGDDFRFGHDRLGDKQFLKQAGFSVDSLATVSHHNLRISSTILREVLSKGDLAGAKALLGKDYTLTGTVIDGDKIGRTLNFPTANIALNRLKPALRGVFGADVIAHQNNSPVDLSKFATDGKVGITGIHPNSLFGAVNIGTRPSVYGTDYRLEVHLPAFAGDLYGLTLQVIFVKYLHDELTYPDLSALKAGIHNDIKALLTWHKQRSL